MSIQDEILFIEDKILDFRVMLGKTKYKDEQRQIKKWIKKATDSLLLLKTEVKIIETKEEL